MLEYKRQKLSSFCSCSWTWTNPSRHGSTVDKRTTTAVDSNHQRAPTSLGSTDVGALNPKKPIFLSCRPLMLNMTYTTQGQRMFPRKLLACYLPGQAQQEPRRMQRTGSCCLRSSTEDCGRWRSGPFALTGAGQAGVLERLPGLHPQGCTSGLKDVLQET